MMITLNLKPIFAARGIDKPYTFLVYHGMTPQTAKTLASGKRKSIEFKYIEQLCKLLWCSPNDLLLWQPHAQEQVSPDHPLRPLLPREGTELKNINKLMSRVPLEKLLTLSGKLNEEIKGAIDLE